MYVDYFGFSQQPFSIAPDPRFLFLGPRHQEALQHLRHGLMGSGGFLLLTGEVGTGKTTLSRAILAELGDNLEVVFILNPKLSERELLAAIAQGFGLKNASESDSLKSLTDAISQYLQHASTVGKLPVVLIDEAQHLYPNALEQLRLLTNLETNARKLLSVVLIGQPELHDLLQQNQLRQVAQRIVARYQLMPFTQAETKQYIQHRLEIAGAKHEIFDKAAQRLVWKLTQGTPRLINLLCDRALQRAAMAKEKTVSVATIHNARDVLPQHYLPQHYLSQHYGTATAPTSRPVRGRFALGLLVIALISTSAWYYLAGTSSENEMKPEPAVTVVSTPQTVVQSVTPATGFSYLREPWQLGAVAMTEQPCVQLQGYNLHCVQTSAPFQDVLRLKIPFIQSVQAGGVITVLGANEAQSQVLIADADGERWVTTASLQTGLSEGALLLIPKPSFFNNNESEAWQDWLDSAVVKLLPLSLQSATQEQQRQWLNDSGKTFASDDSWTFARLFARSESYAALRGLFKTRDNDSANDSDAVMEVTDFVAGFAADSPNLPMEMLAIAPIEIEWPALAERVAAAQSNTVATEDKAAVAEAPVSDTLRALFDDAVRNVPPPVEATQWSFDLNSPVPVLQVPEPQAADSQEPETEEPVPSNATLPWLSELSADARADLPALNYDQHNYRGDPAQRWIVLGNQRLAEGDQLEGVTVISIQAGYSILAKGDVLFRVEALESL
ncbi:AAA family ATPase [Aliidiomarina celeris]|uniref:AAA family ATPase n=1 Tax=Aliidiomarina celeris TaxID=2249428 RepID=UPI000DE9B017|nr:AAA family ATPase [Aliidiomarina celeris]